MQGLPGHELIALAPLIMGDCALACFQELTFDFLNGDVLAFEGYTLYVGAATAGHLHSVVAVRDRLLAFVSSWSIAVIPWVMLQLDGRPLQIISVHLPHSWRQLEDFLTSLGELRSCVHDHSCVVAGDFNVDLANVHNLLPAGLLSTPPWQPGRCLPWL